MNVPGPCTCGEPMVLGTRTIIVTWIAPADCQVTLYQLDCSQNGVSRSIDIPASDTIMSYQLSDLLPNIPIEVGIRASGDGENWGPRTQFPSVVPLDPPSTGPSSATAILLDNKRDIEVSWTPPVPLPEGSFRYSVESVSDSPYTIQYGYQTSDISQTSHIFTNLSPGVSYAFRVKILNNAGESEGVYTESIEIPFMEPTL